MVFRVSCKLFEKTDVALSDFYLRDFKCQGNVSPNNRHEWVFNVTSLGACGTKMRVRVMV